MHYRYCSRQSYLIMMLIAKLQRIDISTACAIILYIKRVTLYTKYT